MPLRCVDTQGARHAPTKHHRVLKWSNDSPLGRGEGRQALGVGHGSGNPPRRHATAVATTPSLRHPSREGIFIEAL